MWLVEGSMMPSVSLIRMVAGLVMAGVGLTVAIVSPFAARYADRRGRRPPSAARRIRRRFTLAGELLACTCIAIGLSGISTDMAGVGFLFLLGGVSSLLSILVLLAAYRLQAHSAADASASPPEGRE
jgi:MFS family permease